MKPSVRTTFSFLFSLIPFTQAQAQAQAQAASNYYYNQPMMQQMQSYQFPGQAPLSAEDFPSKFTLKVFIPDGYDVHYASDFNCKNTDQGRICSSVIRTVKGMPSGPVPMQPVQYYPPPNFLPFNTGMQSPSLPQLPGPSDISEEVAKYNVKLEELLEKKVKMEERMSELETEIEDAPSMKEKKEKQALLKKFRLHFGKVVQSLHQLKAEFPAPWKSNIKQFVHKKFGGSLDEQASMPVPYDRDYPNAMLNNLSYRSGSPRTSKFGSSPYAQNNMGWSGPGFPRSF